MNANHDISRIVRSWIREEESDSADRVLQIVLSRLDTMPQRRSWWPAWRTNRMNTYAKLVAAAAAVLVVAIGGYQSLPGGSGSGGTNATPSPSPALLARGNFVIRDWDTVEFEATRDGSGVTGRMTVGLEEGTSDFLRVDLQCARTAEDGLIMIGGYTDGAGGRFKDWPEGTLAAIVLKRESPVEAQIWAGSIVNWPATQTTNCPAYLDAWLTWSRTSLPGGDWLRDDIEEPSSLVRSAGESVDGLPRPSDRRGRPTLTGGRQFPKAAAAAVSLRMEFPAQGGCQ